MRADLLTAAIPGLDEALAAVDGFDQALTAGFLRPQPAHADALFVLADALGGTPLADRVAEAAEKTAAGAAGEDHLTAFAAARTAVFGAVHDALLARIDEATGRTRAAWETPDKTAPHAPNLRAAARSWLADLAMAGWRGLDHELVAASGQAVTAMLPDVRMRRLAALLDGFAAELAASCPGATLERVPVRRWADLWTRALILAQPDTPALPALTALAASSAGGATLTAATGRLLPLGIDLHEHATAAQAQVHAVFEPADGGPARLVRASVSAAKPDTVVGLGVWQLLRPHMALLAAFSEGRAMELDGMPMTAEGDLLWNDEHAKPGTAADPFATARVVLATAQASAVAPLDRHPARIAEPVFLEGYAPTAHDDGTVTFAFPGLTLPVDVPRLPAAGPLTAEHVAASTSCIGLLRWDGEFSVQPLAVETPVKKKTAAVHAGAWAGSTTDAAGAKAEKAAAEAGFVLGERAGRLLRK